ncbi:MAG: AMP phosphorylase, partial [Desulfurococcaceae archaeon]
MSTRLFKVKVLDVVYPHPVVIVNKADSEKFGLTPGSIVVITLGETYATATVMLTLTIVSEGECAVPENLARQVNIREGDVVGLKPIGLPHSFNALKKRISGQRLTETEYLAILRDVVSGAYGEAEIAAFLLSQLYHPLTDEELSYLIKAMVETGIKIRFEETVYDIHSVGGVPGNSKVALISVPIVAASGLLIPKTSSRAITSPAGTADTMEVLARVDLTADEIVEIARKTKGVLAWGGKLGLAPADDIFVNIERKLAIDPEQQMVASILSKKLSMGVNKLVIDIPTGRGAKVENVQEAERLASLFLRQSSLLGISTKVAITYGGQPIGMSVGPALEAREALKTLIERKGSKSLIDKAFYLAGLILEMSGKA